MKPLDFIQRMSGFEVFDAKCTTLIHFISSVTKATFTAWIGNITVNDLRQSDIALHGKINSELSDSLFYYYLQWSIIRMPSFCNRLCIMSMILMWNLTMFWDKAIVWLAQCKHVWHSSTALYNHYAIVEKIFDWNQQKREYGRKSSGSRQHWYNIMTYQLGLNNSQKLIGQLLNTDKSFVCLLVVTSPLPPSLHTLICHYHTSDWLFLKPVDMAQ